MENGSAGELDEAGAAGGETELPVEDRVGLGALERVRSWAEFSTFRRMRSAGRMPRTPPLTGQQSRLAGLSPYQVQLQEPGDSGRLDADSNRDLWHHHIATAWVGRVAAPDHEATGVGLEPPKRAPGWVWEVEDAGCQRGLLDRITCPGLCWLRAPSMASWPPAGTAISRRRVPVIAKTMAGIACPQVWWPLRCCCNLRQRLLISGGRWRWGLRWRTGPLPRHAAAVSSPADPPRPGTRLNDVILADFNARDAWPGDA